ncbi:nitric oxide-associated protein 1 [Toxorhynchites rutilus septentrionalis]|uniref:nitric oxide-associated protein 1 n=1 Tax=Toxorhynchites rutilus septentrionalis TaxID=329112 RepID=UPI00247835C6|nr:nitric oxide-associated protein 1 [Toxorhynchites rutilus septentrionalis]
MLQHTLKNIASTIPYSRLIHFRSSQPTRCCSTGKIAYDDVFDQLKEKIYYSSVVESSSTPKLGYVRNKILEQRVLKAERHQFYDTAQIQPFPVALQHLYGEKLDEDPPEENDDFEKAIDYIPYEKMERTVGKITVEGNQPRETEAPVTGEWMSDYEYYEEDEQDDRTSFYGTPDPQEPTSIIPCGGCGALLHCAEPSIPGYLPSQLFKGKSKQQLMTTVCQRCHFLKTYNTAINVTVSPKDYVDMISSIKDKKALVVLMVDLLDFPCSIWPGLSEILGSKRSIVVVGNKVDLLPKDCPGYLNNIRDNLTKTLLEAGFDRNNIKHVALISATTGFGVEELITKMHNVWGPRGDVYLVGCTNVGKSSLFNALLRSDFCKVQASDLVQRATACPWPGTTLRMLKFPILRPSDYRLYMRTKRLQSERVKLREEEQLRKQQAKRTKSIEHATLIGHIGRTFVKEAEETSDGFSVSQRGSAQAPLLTLNEKSETYINSKWCYDTPGVVQPDQITNLLTTDELLLTLPKQMIRPRAYLLKVGMSLFLAGLGRLDYIEGPFSTRVLLYSSPTLPTLICDTSCADQIYEHLLGSPYLLVPRSDPERLAKWPRLECPPDILLTGTDKHISVADIVLSSAGWIAIALPTGMEATFRAWTPEKRGIYVRQPSLLPHGMNLRGKRIRRSLAYRVGNAFVVK